MRTIKIKVIAGIVFCSVLSAAIIGLLSIQSAGRIAREDSAQVLKLNCINQSEKINALISRVEQSVDTLADIALQKLDFEEMRKNPDYEANYTAQMDSLIYEFAGHTEGAITAYLRYNPEFTKPDSGVFYSRTAGMDFEALVPTDFSIYEKTDLEHVGWYYIPVENKAPIWMEPYLNENINVYMISYVVPLYVDGTSVGIIGMDIEFSQITDIVRETSIYDTGYAFLSNANGEIMYHKELAIGEAISSLKQEGLDRLAEFFRTGGMDGTLFEYTYFGEKKDLVYETLENGMYFALSAPSREITASADQLRNRILYIMIGAVLIAGIIGILIGFSISRPLKKLTQIIRQTAALDFRENTDTFRLERRKDETGIMASEVKDMRKRLRDMVTALTNAKQVLSDSMDGLDEMMKGNQAASEENSAATEEIAAGMEESASNTNRIASEISEIMERSGQIKTLVNQGQDSSNEVMDRAEVLRNSTGSSSEKTIAMYQAMKLQSEDAVEKSKAVKQIHALTGNIQKISSQTNMLALNASIEAARAGEAGRGFSVVAKQIGELANETFQAVDNINHIVGDVTGAVASLSDCLETTVTFLDQTVLADYQAFQKTAGQYENDAGFFISILEKVHTAVADLNENITEISKAAGQMNQTIEQSASGASLIADKTGELVTRTTQGYQRLKNCRESVEELKEIVGKFRLE